MFRLEYYLKSNFKDFYFLKTYKTYKNSLKAAIKTLKENKLTKTRIVIRDPLNKILAVCVYDFVGHYVKIDEPDDIGRPEKTTILYFN